MSDEYVRKDTFEATMREIRALQEKQDARIEAGEARMERSLMEIRAGNETFKAEVRQELSDMKHMIWAMNERIESSFKFFGWALSIAGVLFAALQVYIALK